MKKILALFLAICISFSLIACKQVDKDSQNEYQTNTEPVPTLDDNEVQIEKLPPSDPAKYESDVLEVYDGKYYDVFQGHIKSASLSYLNDEVICTEDTVFTRKVNDAIWYRIQVGANRNVKCYDNGFIFVENEDGLLIEHKYKKIDASTGKVETAKKEFDAKFEELIYASLVGGEYYILHVGNDVYYNNTTVIEPLFGQTEDNNIVPIDQFFVLSDFEQVVMVKNTLYSFNKNELKIENDRVIAQLKQIELENIDKIISINSNYAFVVEKEEESHICTYSMLGPNNKKEAKIKVPDGYTVNDIKELIHGADGMMIFRFSDGKYFELSNKNFDESNSEKIYKMTINETLNTITSNEHCLNIIGDSRNVYALMDDGYLYIVK